MNYPQPDQCSNAVVDAGVPPQDNNALQPAPMPIHPEANIPGPNDQANFNDNGQFLQNARDACVRLDMVELGPVNAPALDMVAIEVPQDEAQAPVERPVVAAPVELPRVAAPLRQLEAAEDMFNYPIEEELSSMSSETTSSTETSSTETSDEDNLPLIPFYSPGPGNGPRVPMIYVPSRYPPGVRPIEPVARRFGGLPQPSRPILIPPPSRPRPPDDDDESSSSDMTPARSKRCRSDRRQ